MESTREIVSQLAILKRSLRRGDQKRLAKALHSHPNRVGMAFDGFVTDPDFLNRLRNETRKLIELNEVLTA